MLNCSVIRNIPVNNKGANTLFLKINTFFKKMLVVIFVMILFLWALSVLCEAQQGTTCICEDIAYVAMNPLQQHAERLTDGCCSAFQRSG